MHVAMVEPTDTRLRHPLVEDERPFTVDDLDHMPDDGRRYELIDGLLVVSAAPDWLHQRAAMELGYLLRHACPPGLEVIMAPFAVEFDESTRFQPDVLVTESRHYSRRGLLVPPLLAVEVISPSTAMFDRNTKRLAYERAGTPTFWLVEPAARPAQARLEVWQLTASGRYEQVADLAGAEVYEGTEPYPVTVSPAALVCER
jgi:Uma2 family endonuclease